MNHRLKLCPTGKWTFFSEADAWKRLCEVKLINRRGLVNKEKVPSRVYQCPDCGFWHFTSISRPH